MIRLLLAAVIGLVSSWLGTRVLIDVLRRRRIGQPIHEDLGESHQVKAGTPTMGGIAIVGSALLAYALSDSYRGIYTRTGIFVMLAIVGAAAVGLWDDWIKVTRERNLGLKKGGKIAGLAVVVLGFPYLILEFTNQHTTLSFTRFDAPGWDLGTIGWFAFAVFMLVATSNALNLTDGMDGLAAGSAALNFAAFVVIGFWMFRHPEVYATPHALDLAVIAAAMMGSCTGFLWWNTSPARIFMGDTGSLAIGTALAALALTTNTQLLLPVLGAVYVFEAASVIVLNRSFRWFGKRPFHAPFHHHLGDQYVDGLGWAEPTVVVRLWIVVGLCTAFALGLFYADFITVPGVVEL